MKKATLYGRTIECPDCGCEELMWEDTDEVWSCPKCDFFGRKIKYSDEQPTVSIYMEMAKRDAKELSEALKHSMAGGFYEGLI